MSEQTGPVVPEELSVFQSIVVIQLNRLYDIGITFLGLMNEDKARELVALHEQGLTLAPDPAVAEL